MTPARPHDIQSIDTFLDGFAGIAPAGLLLERHGIIFVTPQRKNMKTKFPNSLLKFCKRVRKRIETAGSHLTKRFKTDQIRAHDLWHFQHRLIRKILAHTVDTISNFRLQYFKIYVTCCFTLLI
ncbi:hypothetical protein [Candidatus Electronema sp. JM]|uniref:hypothetical protein n=1 Tax=Candidatus Electronema sp. JM TaxID=3401571 RepID=UPI003AA877F3